MKRSFKLLLCIIAIAALLVSCELPMAPSDTHGHAFVDANNDNVCDTCNSDGAATHGHAFVDANGDEICDTCNNDGTATHGHAFADANGDGICDTCNTDGAATHGHAFVDEDNNGKCDTCAPAVCAHTFGDEWKHDATNHWLEATCGCADVKGALNPHVDADEDRVCDVCDYEISYVIDVVAPDAIDVSGTSFEVDPGADVTFTAAISDAFILNANGAVQVGEAVVADGVRTYTFTVEDVMADDTVEISLERIVYGEEIKSGTGTWVAADWVDQSWYMTVSSTVVVENLAPGKYAVITWGSYVDEYEEEILINPTVNDDYAPYVFEIEEATAEFSLVLALDTYGAAPESCAYGYRVVALDDEVELNDAQGEGYTVPTGVTMNATYVAPATGVYCVTSTADVLFGEYRTGSLLVYAEEGEIISFIFKNENVEEDTFEFDWNIKLVEDADFAALVLGENDIEVTLGAYTFVKFTAEQAGVYTVGTANGASFAHFTELWDGSIGLSTIYDNPVTLNLEAGDVIFYYVSDNYAEDSYDEVVTVTFVGTAPAENTETEDVTNDYKVPVSVAGTPIVFVPAEYGLWNISCGADFLMSTDGETWVNEIELETDAAIAFVIKTADALSTATEAVITIETRSYELSATAGEFTSATVLAGKDYLLDLGYTSFDFILTWDNDNIVVTIDGVAYTEGEVASYSYSWWGGTQIFVSTADGVTEAQDIEFFLIDASLAEINTGDNTIEADGAYFIPTTAGWYVFNVTAGEVDGYVEGEYFYVQLEAGEYYEVATENPTELEVIYLGEELSENVEYNVNVASTDRGYIVSFIALEDGWYAISTAEGETNACLCTVSFEYFTAYGQNYSTMVIDETPVIYGSGSYKMELEAGDIVYFAVSTVNGEADEINLVVAPSIPETEVVLYNGTLTIAAGEVSASVSFTAPVTSDKYVLNATTEAAGLLYDVTAPMGTLSGVSLPLEFSGVAGGEYILTAKRADETDTTEAIEIQVTVTATLELGTVIGTEETTDTVAVESYGFAEWSYTAEVAGTYTFNFEGDNVMVFYPTDSWDPSTLPLELELEAGETITVAIGSQASVNQEVEITIEAPIVVQETVSEIVVTGTFTGMEPCYVSYTFEEAGSYVIAVSEDTTDVMIDQVEEPGMYGADFIQSICSVGAPDYYGTPDCYSSTITVEAGETVWFQLGFYDWNATGDISFTINPA